MLYKTIIASLALAGILSAAGCSEPSGNAPQWAWPDPDSGTGEIPEPEPEQTETNPDIVSLGWKNVEDEFGALPEGIAIYRSPEQLEGKNAIAYIAVADLSKAGYDIWSISDPESDGTDEPFMTPSEVYGAEGNGQPAVVINGGFFYMSGSKYYTSSLAVRNGKLLSPNINYASEDWVTIYYPTRAAFVEHKDGSFEACWTYYVSSAAHYAYPEPASNSWSSAPAAQPSASFPEGAETFEAETAIGGGPLLIRDGVIRNTYVEELFDGPTGIAPDSDQPRTAIGTTSDGRMILFVCEGRQRTEGVAGLLTEDVANVLLDLGCTQAVNLDGGGSSCMLVNGHETIKPSDGAQRSVASTVMLMQR